MKYFVIRIDEDIDFGCEERPEGYQPMVLVTLQAEDSQTISIRQPDQMLYDRDINEGDTVVINAMGELEKDEVVQKEPSPVYHSVQKRQQNCIHAR